MTELSEQFQAALVSYDEGMSDDRVMAAAIWRRFYSLSVDTKAENIEAIVKYIRHQVCGSKSNAQKSPLESKCGYRSLIGGSKSKYC